MFREWKAVTSAAAKGLASLLLEGFGGRNRANVVRMRAGTEGGGLGALLANSSHSRRQHSDAIVQYTDGRLTTQRLRTPSNPVSARVTVPLTDGGQSNDTTLVGIVLAGLQATRYQSLTANALGSLVTASRAVERGMLSYSAEVTHKGGSIVVDWAGGFKDVVNTSPIPSTMSSTQPRSPQWSPSSPSDAKLTSSQLNHSMMSAERPVAFPMPVASLGPEWAQYGRDEYVWVTQREDGGLDIVPPPPQSHNSRQRAMHPSVSARLSSRPVSPATTRSSGHASRRSTSVGRYREEYRPPVGVPEPPAIVSVELPLQHGAVPLSARSGGTVAVIFTESTRLRALGCFFRIFSRYTARLAS